MIKEKIDLIIGIPSYNEEDSIRNVVQKIDLGLIRYFPKFSSLIVNIDSDSEDNTKIVFLETTTKTKKYFISGGKSPRGKGVNIIKLFQLAKKLNAKYICTFDADLITITENWPKLLLNPLIKKTADVVFPLYTRNRYEGNTTNHFCYPLIFAGFGRNIRQPIAGDFGMNRKFVNYILKQEVPYNAKFYGIDIFLTIHALGGRFKTRQIFLGRKIHKSSFEKITLMFPQIAITTIQTLAYYPRNKPLINKKISKKQNWVDRFIRMPSEKKVKKLYEYALKNISQMSICEIEKTLGMSNSEVKGILNKKNKLNQDLWVKILTSVARGVSKNQITSQCAEKIVILLAPFFYLRVVSFFDEIKRKSKNFSENIIENQTKKFIKLINQ